MAFFGLTALGPQNTFETLSTDFRYIQVFDEDDFAEAWEKALGKGAVHCLKHQIPEITKVLFQGPVPLNEEGPISDAFESVVSDTITLDTFLKIMIRLRTEAEEEARKMEGKPKPTCEFNSSSELTLSLKKNAAMKRELQTKLTAPLTATQEYGWAKQDLQGPVAGRGGSDITRFASELIKNGIYY
mmetsp:Transcript_30785/g.52068  ORF Transcript_30785/g.52068 Transcript_30785/m.52068 type:complete len:186 (-) Transcript_30785:172-729(-)